MKRTSPLLRRTRGFWCAKPELLQPLSSADSPHRMAQRYHGNAARARRSLKSKYCRHRPRRNRSRETPRAAHSGGLQGNRRVPAWGAVRAVGFACHRGGPRTGVTHPCHQPGLLCGTLSPPRHGELLRFGIGLTAP